MSRFSHLVCLLTCGFTLLTAGLTRATDWPQWRGPQRDGVWRESGVIDAIPDSGLPVKWRTEVGLGYSGPAVADGKVFVADYQKQSGELTNSAGGLTELTGEERLLCLDAKTGEEIWKVAYDQPYRLSYAGGPRCTPTVDGDRVYFLGAEGRLGCYKTANGDVVWSKDLTSEYETKTPHWGFAAHPLVDGDLLYCIVGGQGSVAVAFNKMTGEEVWRALEVSEEQGYCPPTMIEAAGVRQLLIWTPETLYSLNPQTGETYWSLPFQPRYGMSVTAPVKQGDKLYVTGVGTAGLIELADGEPGAEFVWKGNTRSAVYSCNTTPFIEDGTIYGCDTTSALIAARLSDGERLWTTTEPTVGDAPRARYGTAFIVKHDDHFFLFSEKGDLILADLTPDGYRELGRFHVLEPTNQTGGRDVVWSHPAFANKCLFARNDKEIVCVDLSK